jgi:hypothetical protein
VNQAFILMAVLAVLFVFFRPVVVPKDALDYSGCGTDVPAQPS